MNDKHPITPPPELVLQWREESSTGELHFSPQYLATQAARWGADQELDACCEWVSNELSPDIVDMVRTARRPKPPSLKEQALRELGDAYDKGKIDDTTYDTIKRALEALPNE